MKILHTISSVNPAGGGPVEGLKQLGTINESHGHQIEVVSLDPPDSEFIRDFPFRLYPVGPARLTYGYSPKLLPWLEANASRYDAVIVNGIWQYNSFATWRALHKSSTPYVVFTHGMLDPWFKRTYPIKHLKKWLYWPWAEYRVLRDAAAVLFTCEEERRLARESFWLYAANEQVVNYGTSAPVGDRNAQREKFLEAFPALRGKRIILFLGRIHVKKGCDLALEAFAQTLSKDASYHLVMAGPDQNGWKASLLSSASSLGISEKITWTGMITGDQKWGALHASDVFLLPSHQENFGIVVAESLACGLPVLISDKVNIWREVVEDSAGFAANDDLPGTRKLLQAWADLTDTQKLAMRHAAITCFDKRFEINRASATLLEVLREVRKSCSSDLKPETIGAES